MTRTAAAIGVILLSLLFFGFWAWQYHRHTPEAAVHEIAAAVSEGDTAVLSRRVDLESVLTAAELDPDPRHEDSAAILQRRFALIRSAAAAGDPALVAEDIHLHRLLRTVFSDAEYAGVLSTEQDGSRSRLWIGLRYPELDTLARVRLRLEDSSSGWRVTRVEDLAAFADALSHLRQRP